MRSLAARWRGGGGGVIPAGLHLSTTGIYLVEELENRELARGRIFGGSIPLVYIGGRGEEAASLGFPLGVGRTRQGGIQSTSY